MSSAADDLALKLEWYGIRDLLLGEGGKPQDVKRALELATTCKHPDAQWLSRIFAGKDAKTWDEAREVFLAQGEDDARALGFIAVVDEYDQLDVDRMCRSAEMGFAFAQARLAGHYLMFTFEKEEAFRFASLAALQGEREGFCNLGYCFKHGVGCERNVEEGKKNMMLAMEMNDGDALGQYGGLLDESDPQRWYWMGLAARRGFPYAFLQSFTKQISRLDTDPFQASVVFMIGRYLRGRVDWNKKRIFGSSVEFESRVGPANRAIDFFNLQCASARKAVDTWCLIARRIAGESVNRDIRKKIGMLIWEARELGGYAVEPVEGGATLILLLNHALLTCGK